MASGGTLKAAFRILHRGLAATAMPAGPHLRRTTTFDAPASEVHFQSSQRLSELPGQKDGAYRTRPTILRAEKRHLQGDPDRVPAGFHPRKL